jgi:transcriptional regulator with XRE-family HTH domain
MIGVVMDQEKIGKFIRELRKNNNLTQNDLALKYNVFKKST